MSHNLIQICLLLVISLRCLVVGFSQVPTDEEILSEVSRVLPPISLTPDEARSVETLMDISPYYNPKWVKEYISVEIKATVDESVVISKGTDEVLTTAQIQLINSTDEETIIWASVSYQPDNTLAHNETKEHVFSFTIDPVTEAHYKNGYSLLAQQLQTEVVDQLDPAVFEGYTLAAITFTVDKDGKVRDAQVAESTEDEGTDQLLLDAICKMTDWAPATYASGLTTEQDFVWIIGNKQSCKMNFFNTRRGLAKSGN